VGFARVDSEDRTDQFVEMLTKELKFVETNKDKVIAVSELRLGLTLQHVTQSSSRLQ